MAWKRGSHQYGVFQAQERVLVTGSILECFRLFCHCGGYTDELKPKLRLMIMMQGLMNLNPINVFVKLPKMFVLTLSQITEAVMLKVMNLDGER